MKKVNEHGVMFDLIAVLLSIVVAIVLVRSGAFNSIIAFTGPYVLIGAFITGLLFTSAFTMAVAIASIIEFAQVMDPIALSLAVACGAVVSDLGLLSLVKNRLMPDFKTLIAHTRFRRFVYVTRRKWFRIMSPFLGALIIASPFPDELGIAMMGFSKMQIHTLIPILFLMNFLGALIIVVAATS